MTFNGKQYAYAQIRNYICEQIVYENDNKNYALHESVMRSAKENDNYVRYKEDMIDTYQHILGILTNNKDKIIK